MNNWSLSSFATFSDKFQRFAEECKGNSPLYETLSRQIAKDESLLQLCIHVREGQPVPNSFLAAVHFLVLRNQDASIAKYYPSVSGLNVEAIPFHLFKAFVKDHQQEIINILKYRIVQTNVLTRCNYLLPVFATILSQANNPATIIDIGASAGLNLNFDHYEYYYNNQKVYGNSNVKLHCQLKGDLVPAVKSFNTSIQKIGIDQHLIDPSNPDDLTWLLALIWPDQTERFAMLNEAVTLQQHSPVQLIKGSTISEFKNIIESVNTSHTLILYATHVLYQFSESLLQDFNLMLDTIGQQRDYYFLSAEATKAMQLKYNTSNTAVVLTSYKNKHKQEIWVAETNGHGNWMQWLDQNIMNSV